MFYFCTKQYFMKVSDGFSKLTPSILTIVFMIASFALLSYAMKTLPLGTAYTVWTGIGAVGTVLVGIIVFKEPATFLRLFFITTLIGSIIGLKVVSH